MKILLDPDTEHQGGGNSNQQDPPPTPPPTNQDGERNTDPPKETPPPTPPPGPSAEQLRQWEADRQELQRLRAQESERQRKEREAVEARQREKGQYEEIVKSRDEELRQLREQNEQSLRTYKETLVERELALELGKHRLVEGWQEHLHALLKPKLEAVEADGKFRVQTKDLKNLGDFVKEQLSRPEFKHILRAEDNDQGGTGGKGGSTPPGNDDAKPKAEDLATALFGRNPAPIGAMPGFGRYSGAAASRN